MSDKKAKIALLGCGWLGFPLAEVLVNEKYSVHGSTTSLEKLPLLQAKGITPFFISLSESEITGDLSGFLEGCETLILNIPPKLRANPAEDFVAKITLLVRALGKSSVEKVLFISSTSVYADQEGVAMIDENTAANPDTESGKQLLKAEIILQQCREFQTTLLRFGGLVGEDRHPIKHLAGKENLAAANAPVNLIHLEDCIGIILKIVQNQAWDTTFNAVAPEHPTREAFYHKKAQEMNLPIPKFVSEKTVTGKIISSEKTERVLGYSFGKNKL